MHIVRIASFAAALAVATVANAATIIGGTTGDGDFEVAGGTGAMLYTVSPNWFNASGSEGINFTNTNQMAGSSQPGSRGGMPFQNRTQVNNTGYTIGAAGEVFSLSYDFGAGGGPAGWNGAGDETMTTFLFTAAVAVDGNLTTADMTELGVRDAYDVDRAADGQWTTRTVPTLYTSTAADIGSTVYFGMEFLNDSGNDLFPRIDVVQLDVAVAPVPEPSSLIVFCVMSVGMLAANRRRS